MRGAPAIAIVGCLSLAVELRKENFDNKKQLRQEIEGKLNYLVSSRPTAVNMKIAADELIALANKLSEDDDVKPEDMKVELVACFICLSRPYNRLFVCSFLNIIEQMLEKDVKDNEAIGDYGAKEILAKYPGDNLVRILTHCNTGSLATAGYGTALGVIRTLHALKRLGELLRKKGKQLLRFTYFY